MSPIQTKIIEKIRLSGCLSEEEFKTFHSCSENWETRQNIYRLDYLWAEEVPSHLIQANNNGVKSYHLPTSGNSKLLIFCGVLLIVIGLTCVPLVPPGLLMVGMGIFAIFKSRNLKSGWETYNQSKGSHDDQRRTEMDRLPVELQPANRTCLRCANVIT